MTRNINPQEREANLSKMREDLNNWAGNKGLASLFANQTLHHPTSSQNSASSQATTLGHHQQQQQHQHQQRQNQQQLQHYFSAIPNTNLQHQLLLNPQTLNSSTVIQPQQQQNQLYFNATPATTSLQHQLLLNQMSTQTFSRPTSQQLSSTTSATNHQQQQNQQHQQQGPAYNMNSSDYSSSTYHIYDQILGENQIIDDLIVIKQERMKQKLEEERRRKVILFSLGVSLLVGLLMFSVVQLFKAASSSPQQASFPSQAAPHQPNSISMPRIEQNYPPPKLMDSGPRPEVDINKWAVTEQYAAGESSTASPDVLSSKLLIGEFVILSQNYTNSEAQRSALAENVVKLMDQVFLSTDVRRVYSRMQVAEIRPHAPSGVVVKCQIILSESIIYAAQQFGIALYDSLAKSNEKLANQPSFIIDKNSIRFNTIPDKDLAMVPPQLLPTALSRPDAAQAPSDGNLVRQQLADLKPAANPAGGDQSQDQNAVVWSEWSQWSSCVDKNGMCDPSRLHSRLRKCVSQHTGEKVEAAECRQRFNMQDLELEVTDCSATCAGSPMSPQQQQAGVQSDAPLVIMPHTAPSMMVADPSSEATPTFLLPAPLNRAIKQQQQQHLGQPSSAQKLGAYDPISALQSGSAGDLYLSGAGSGAGEPAGSRQQSALMNGLLTSTQSSPVTSAATPEGVSSVMSATQASANAPVSGAPTLDGQQQQMSCSNCTSDEICLLLVSQKMPFCAKIKDRLDESGCGGWCKSKDEVCQPAGQNAFKCTHNSECLPDEWRCHDSLCIPASKRCDGHDNCFDSSDERYCPSPN